MRFYSIEDLLHAYRMSRNYPRIEVHELTKDRWLALVCLSPVEPAWIVGSNYTTELEAEFYAKRKLQELTSSD